MYQLPTHLPLKFTNSTGKEVELHSPNDGKLLTRVQMATHHDIEVILGETKKAQTNMEKLKPYERAQILHKVAQELKHQEDYLAWIIASEGGKPLKDAKVEAQRSVATIELCAEETMRLEGEVVQMERTPAGKDHLAFTIKAPIGPVLAISAFNHPLNLISHQVGTAIAAGNSVVLKPASTCPLSAHFLYEAFMKAGLPRDGLRVINAKVDLIENLVSSSEFNFVSFIGSAKVGWEMRKKVANGTRMSMEHGGQAAAIIREDADMEAAVTACLKGAYYHAGQVCISTQRIFVQENIFDKFVDLFKAGAEKLYVGPATDEKTDIGPLIKPEEVERIQKWIAEATKAGGKIILGNDVSGSMKQYLSATILILVPRDTKLMQEEVFGPVVCINPYRDEDELLHYLNENPYIFESALFTKDITKAMQIAHTISSMTFVINNHTAFRVDQMPFGGHKLSGYGMGGVKYAMEEQTRMKQVIVKY